MFHDDVAVLQLDNGKANALNPELLQTLSTGLDAFDESSGRALVLTGYDRFFSAGLDLVTLRALDRGAMGAFMGSFDVILGRLFRCPRPVVAAVNGHAVAGGCVLANQADWRVLAEGNKVKYGTNETQLGVGLPPGALPASRQNYGPEATVRGFLLGELFRPDQALELGLVHELAPPAEVLPRALEFAERLAAVPPLAFAQVKEGLQGSPPSSQAHKPILERWLDTWFSDEAQGRIHAIVDGLSKP